MKNLVCMTMLTLFTATSSFGYVVNEGWFVEDTCYELAGEDIDGGLACEITSTTTSLPTVIIDAQNVAIDSEEALAKAIEEMDMPAEEALTSQTIAEHLEVSTEDVQVAVASLYGKELAITLESIAAELE